MAEMLSSDAQLNLVAQKLIILGCPCSTPDADCGPLYVGVLACPKPGINSAVQEVGVTAALSSFEAFHTHHDEDAELFLPPGHTYV